jgi:predicted pyridoxine 5'-phosphate oxidase superfamily flavin-nucleotide-binding protein
MFSASVRAEQSRRGSRERQARRAAQGRFQSELSAEVIRFIGERNSLYFATASADGQPYVQHRGGPAGFLSVLDARTLAFANYAGNAQYISFGNLAENDRAFVFLMDYAAGRRLKLWGRARVVDDPALLERLADAAPEVRLEQALVFTVLAWDWNCSQHIPCLVPAIACQTREGE